LSQAVNVGYANWREYQEAVARFFRERGCAATVEAQVPGARATHIVDVFVSFHQHGVDVRWVIECKLWKGRVEKADVLVLKGVVEDVGADRGIIFCETEFQSGARDAVRHSNILLVSSLDEFKRTVSLGDPGTTLAYLDANLPNLVPVYRFPGGDKPEHLLLYNDRIFVANWEPGNIAIVDPATKSIESVINLDKYEVKVSGNRKIEQYPPGNMACADGRLFVGQVFSEFILVIDIATQSIVKRIPIAGGGQGAIAASKDGRTIYFASNTVNRFFVIDSATYEYEEVAYPGVGRGSMCVLPHPSKPLLYIGIQRGGTLNGKSYPWGNCFLATYDLAGRRYASDLYLAEVTDGRSDDATPCCLTYDEMDQSLFVGMFQSQRGICRVDEGGRAVLANFRFTPNENNTHFKWVDPLCQALYKDRLLSTLRNNGEMVMLDKRTGGVASTLRVCESPNGPHALVVWKDLAIMSYPSQRALVFHDLARA
jgi:Restriction endonuclease